MDEYLEELAFLIIAIRAARKRDDLASVINHQQALLHLAENALMVSTEDLQAFYSRDHEG